MWILQWYTLGNLNIKSCSHRLFGNTIKRRARGVLASRMALKIHYRLFFKYLIAKYIAEDAIKSSKAGLKTEPIAKSLSSSSILLSIKEKAWDIRVIKSTIEA